MRVQEGELGRVVLGVAIGVEDQVFGGLGEHAPQVSAVAKVGRVVQHAEARVQATQLVKDVGGPIGAGVVADNDLVVIRQVAQGAAGGDDDAGDRAGVVVAGEEGGDGRA